MVELRKFAVSQVGLPSRNLSVDQIIPEAEKLVKFIQGQAVIPEYCEFSDPVEKLISEMQKMQSKNNFSDEKPKDIIS